MNLKERYKKETGKYVRFRETEGGKKLYYDDYVDWIERQFVELCNLQSVSNSVCPDCGSLITNTKKYGWFCSNIECRLKKQTDC